MENANYSISFLQKRKFYTALPLLVLPFVTLLYWLLVVKNLKTSETNSTEASGFNTSLPDAFLKDKRMDKLSYYQKSAEDSAKRAEQIKRDPYRQQQPATYDPLSGVPLQGLEGPYDSQKRVGPVFYKGRRYDNPNEARVFGKLKELDVVISQSAQSEFSPKNKADLTETPVSLESADMEKSHEIQRLESMMAAMQSDPVSGEEDPEMEQLNGMLEKILDIQHPERLTDKIQKQSQANQKQVFAVTNSPEPDLITYLGDDSLSTSQVSSLPFQQNGFFSLDAEPAASTQNAIPAVIDQDQQLVSGSTIKIRLTGDIYIGGILIPKDSFIFGTATLNNERLMVEIITIRHENALLPVKLSVYDLDGIAGIYIPGAISRDVGKQSLSQDINGLNIGTFDSSLGAQAASAGIQAAKTLLGKKARLVKVTVKAGYQVLLRDGNAKAI